MCTVSMRKHVHNDEGHQNPLNTEGRVVEWSSGRLVDERVES